MVQALWGLQKIIQYTLHTISIQSTPVEQQAKNPRLDSHEGQIVKYGPRS